MNGYWIFAVYSYNPKNGNKNYLKYFKSGAKAEAYCIICDKELREVGRYAGIHQIWVED